MSGRIDYKITMYPQCIPRISAPLPPVLVIEVPLEVKVLDIDVNGPGLIAMLSDSVSQLALDSGSNEIPITVSGSHCGIGGLLTYILGI